MIIFPTMKMKTGMTRDYDFVELQCPECGETIYFDEDMLESGEELLCPNCNALLVPTLEEDDDGERISTFNPNSTLYKAEARALRGPFVKANGNRYFQEYKNKGKVSCLHI